MYETREERVAARGKIMDDAAARARRVRATGTAVIIGTAIVGACCAGGAVWAVMQTFGSC